MDKADEPIHEERKLHSNGKVVSKLLCIGERELANKPHCFHYAILCDNSSLRMQMTEQNKTIDSIRKEPQNKYERVLVGCKDTALFPGKIPGMMDSFFLACLRRVNPVRS